MADSGIRHVVSDVPVPKSQYEDEEHHALIHGTSFPSSPVERQLYYRDDLHAWYIYNGSAWVSLQAAAIDKLNDIGDVSVAAPGNNTFLYRDAGASLWKARTLVDADIPAAIARDAEVAAGIAAHAVHAAGVHGLGSNSFAGVLTSGQFIKFNTAQHVFYLVNVGATPHTSNITAIAGSTIDVTATHGKKFFNPYMTGASYMHLWNTTRGTDAWIEDIDGVLAAPGDVLTLTAAVPGDWQVGDALLASVDGASEWMEVDCSPGVAADAYGAFLEMSVKETGALSAAVTLAVSAGGGAAPSLWSQVVDRVVVLYSLAPFYSARTFRVRLRAGAAASIAAVAFYIYGEIHALTQAT